MAEENKLSLWSAILVNINVMFGTGVFINTVQLASTVGFFGFISYAISALLLFPLIRALMLLIEHYPEGGFYSYGSSISPFAGFMAAWVYFVGKLASATLLVHIFCQLMQAIIAPLANINIFYLDIFILLLLGLLNRYNFKLGIAVNYIFITLKLTPILFAIITSVYLLNYWHIPPEALLFHEIPSTIPLVVYAFLGFEAACSLSSHIKDAKKNGPKAIMYSFLFVISITIIYQALIFLANNTHLMAQSLFLDVFPTHFKQLMPRHPLFAKHTINILHIAAASAALGGAYGIIFSNAWNLYTLAQKKHLPYYPIITKFNAYSIPFFCVATEIGICLFYLAITQAHQPTLQVTSVLGSTIAYSLSAFGLVALLNRNHSLTTRFIAYSACLSCLLLLSLCVRLFIIKKTFVALLIFSAILSLGSGLFWYARKKYSYS